MFNQEEKISAYVNELIAWAEKGDIEMIKASIPRMYEMTDPTIDAINNIMDTKMYYNEEQSEILNKKIDRFSDRQTFGQRRRCCNLPEQCKS